MKKDIKTKMIFPMPVLLIATYNEDNTVDVMNAAWGMQLEMDELCLNLSEDHKTVENIKRNNALTVSLATTRHIKEADYFGLVSANKVKDKFAKSGLTASKSKFVNAPIINEFPLTFECELKEINPGLGVIVKVVNTTIDESILNNGKVDISLLDPITYNPYTNTYHRIGEKVGDAFKEGLALK